MRILPLIIGLLLIAPSHSVTAQPINFAGLDWSMSYQEMKRVLANKGYYRCDDGKFNGWERFSTLRGEGGCNESDRRNLTIDIYSYPSYAIFFQCESFNGCGKSLNKIKNAIEDRYDIKLSRDIHPDNLNDYCGEGIYQDKICLRLDYKGVRTVHLYRHNFLKPSKGDLDF